MWMAGRTLGTLGTARSHAIEPFRTERTLTRLRLPGAHRQNQSDGLDQRLAGHHRRRFFITVFGYNGGLEGASAGRGIRRHGNVIHSVPGNHLVPMSPTRDAHSDKHGMLNG
ncbi:hypothetical protein B5T_03167 [Alloalcanivorax dieselolei B5]|uniref:Uncharacterized protein n=1 Tax=Alcanivorax dieselolei (strain DSM 16502 / CGMCC 1.3690 / MCCC 1A00001 / B-5) TaxID=930169 RepID=K0CCX2_ALCDB|nr:hypothetical protein B5T_03167 [Alloalcanivorax dieselolei B5]